VHGSLFARLFAVAFASAAGGAFANVARQRGQHLPAGLCGEILDQTYGALQGWTPSERQLLAMCEGLLVHSLKVARSRATASGPCRSFAHKVSAEAAAVHRSGSSIPPLPQLKEMLCGGHQQMQQPRPDKVAGEPAFISNFGGEEQARASISSMPEEHPRTTLLTAVGTGVAHESHHHRRHKVLRPVHVDASTMLKLREDLLAGREEINPVFDPTRSLSGGVATKTLQTLQVASVISSREQQQDNGASTTAALMPVANSADADSSTSALASLSQIASSGISWFRDHVGSTIDFICDGGCGPLGVQPRRTQYLIVT